MSAPVGHLPVRAVGLRRRVDALAVGVGLVLLVAAMLIARGGRVPAWERSLFRTVNDLPAFLYPVLWPFQQLGALAGGLGVAVAAALLRRHRLAVAALVATAAKLGGERIVKRIVSRQRPGTSIGPDIHARGDVMLTGESFVSGHAVLISALAGIVVPYLRGRWKLVPIVLVALVMITRVYVGAHNPLDVVGGAALGLVIAGAVNLAFGTPAPGGES
jgi:glycosyltransferase 2 family protein